MAERQIARRRGRRGSGRVASVFASCAVAAALLSACGSSATGVEGRGVGYPSVPTAESCGVGSEQRPASRGEGPGHAESQRPPEAGVYTYRTRGRSGAPREALRGASLPTRTRLVVTRSRRFGDLTCFRMQKRYGRDLANTETYVIRGDELFLVGLRIDAFGESREVRPSPPVLFGSGTGSRWSGQFSGATSGTYSATGLGQRDHDLGGARLRVTGVRSSVSYRGAVSGTQVATIWVTTGRGLIVSEKVALRERLGVTEVRVRLQRSLLEPNPS